MGFYNGTLTFKTSHQSSNFTDLKTVEWLHHHLTNQTFTNVSCLSAPFPHKTFPVYSNYHTFEAVIDWSKLKRFLDYYLSHLDIPIYVGLGNGLFQAMIEINMKHRILKQPQLNFLIWTISYLSNVFAQIFSSHFFIEREHLMELLLSLQDRGFIFDIPHLDLTLEKVDADNYQALLIPHLLASMGILFSMLIMTSFSFMHKKCVSSKITQYFLSGFPVIIGNALANLVVCGNPVRLIGGLSGMLAYLAGDLMAKTGVVLLLAIVDIYKSLYAVLEHKGVLRGIYFFKQVSQPPTERLDNLSSNIPSYSSQLTFFSAAHKALKSISMNKLYSAADRFFGGGVLIIALMLGC